VEDLRREGGQKYGKKSSELVGGTFPKFNKETNRFN
jgi:hypothetical protein